MDSSSRRVVPVIVESERMAIIVQKFGGTSVADTEKIAAAARKAIRAWKEGNQVVVVVSAMGKNTDRLVDLAAQLNGDPPAREMDMLLSTGEQQSVALMAMAIHAMGHKAIGMSGFQLGIVTVSMHTLARIQSIDTERILRELNAGRIVIAAGFQGIDKEGNITTLGRGGSDTTAVALAAVLRAERCVINTDVRGVFTIDPRLVPTARKLEKISYDEMLELASLGAGVMHSRSIEFAKKFRVPVYVRSSFQDDSGTLIGPQPESVEQPICGAAIVKDEARVTILDVDDRPGMAAKLFSAIANQNILVDMVIQNQGERGKTDMSFTVLRKDLNKTLKITQKISQQLNATGVTFDDAVSKISLVGLGMETQPGVAGRMFRALADAGVNISMITTSRIKISVLVAQQQARVALWAVHQAFQLDRPPEERSIPAAVAQSKPPHDATADIKHELELAINEDLTIENVWRDDQQALITISQVPDEPGLAAAVFEAVAADHILVDMIVQDAPVKRSANLSFTVPRANLKTSIESVKRLAEELGAGPVSESEEIDILSVSGVGLRSHTGVAIPMFRALAGDDPDSEGINVRLINTSEVCVSVIVDAKDGEQALTRLKTAFAKLD